MVLRQSQSVADEAAKQLTPRSRMALAFIVFVVIFAGITISSFRLQSPTFDEPIHLLGGYSYLAQGDSPHSGRGTVPLLGLTIRRFAERSLPAGQRS